MNEARPFASLSSGLLARKGAAKPAMRPQAYAGFEDLGWNDMGYDPAEAQQAQAAPEHVPSSIAALTPAPKPAKAAATEAAEPEADREEPAPEQAGEQPIEEVGDEAPSVVAQQRAILESFDGEEGEDEEAAAEPPAPRRKPVRAEIVPLPQRVAVPAGRKSAFTLRLDADRHLKLRLACAVTGRSAQQIVTGALDELLAGIPELDGLAAGAAGAKRN
jgi:hypothetical protein